MEDRDQVRNELQQRKLKHQLETQSRHIEQVFERHQLSAQIAGGAASAGTTRFDLRMHLESGLEKLKDAAQDVREVLGAANVSLRGQAGRFQLTVEEADEPLVSLLDILALVPEWPGVTTLLGVTDTGAPVLMDFRDENTTHILIAGDRDSGKTALLRSLAVAMSLVYRQSRLQLLIIADSEKDQPDPLLEPLRHLPHMLAPVARDLQDATDILDFLVDELAYRRQQQICTPAIVLMIDEIVGLADLGGPAIIDGITRLAQRGASCGIYLVLTTRYPQAASMDELLKSNLPVRLVGQFGEVRQSDAATGIREPSAHYLTGPGEFVAVIDGSEPTQFQAAFVTDYDLHMSLEEMQRNRPIPVLAQPISARELMYGEDLPPEPGAYEPSRFVYDGKEAILSADSNMTYEVLDDEVDDEAHLEEE